MPLEHRFIETNGVRLHCVLDGAGPLVILLHGFPQCWYSWRHQLAALAPHYRVVAPDLRGYNESDKPEGVASYALSESSADIVGLIHALGEREAVIVAHDFGGAVAWTLAAEHPEVVRKLVVLNCPHPAIFSQHMRSNSRQMARSWYMLFFQIPWLPETLLGLNHAWAIGNGLRKTVVRQDTFTEEDIRYFRDAASRPGALGSAINYYRAAFRTPEAAAGLPPGLRRFFYGDRPLPAARSRLEDWPTISAPTLLIWGEADVALGKELTLGMEPLFAGPFAVKYVPFSGHFVHEEQPEVVNRHLLDFLNGTKTAEAPTAGAPAQEA
jgi:pimeloyl-ACP methyl ester carboxylesterase